MAPIQNTGSAQRTAAVIDASRCRKPEYPPASIRAHETGLVVLQFLISPDGTVIDSKIERSSGFRRLDEAAKQGLSLCKFTAGTENGVGKQSWARIEYLWKLTD
ncbi:MAG: energy transducer TonB [Rhodocyclaceae bacterium]|nr:energy transducer TonB [Rhodocyclaceae bacterium]